MSDTVFTWVKQLEKLRIYFTIYRRRSDSLMLMATLVGARVEIDCFEDGHIEYSVFKGDESVESNVEDLLEILRADGASPGILPAWHPAPGRPDLP